MIRQITRTVFLLVCALSIVVDTSAFELRKQTGDVYVAKWYQSSVELDVRLSTITDLDGGGSRAGVFLGAVDIWNRHLSNVRLAPTVMSVASEIFRNRKNEVIMASSVAGDDFSDGTLAVTFTRRSGDTVIESDIVFNDTKDWQDYRGPLRDTDDIRRVALHELGHLLGLLHPDEAGQSVEALMNRFVSDLDDLTADDIAGVQSMYGVLRQTPTNDQLGDASIIELELSGTWNDTGSTVSASREFGEPSHVEVVNGHSVWWRWTPAEDQHATLSTLGSDFDTVMSVYRGSQLGDLMLVDENDDESSAEDSAGHIRTSKLELNATGGSTYFIAVDGWGDQTNFPEGATGEVAIRLKSDLTWVPPTITRQPSDTLVNGGSTARFFIEANGYPELQYRWQLLPVNGFSWAEITSDVSEYDGINTNALEVLATPARNGWQFRCVVTSAAGQLISESKFLRFDANVLPEIQEQPVGRVLTLEDQAVLSVGASNFTGFQWYLNDVAVSGGTGRELDLGTIDANDSGNYRVVATGPTGEISSETVEVKVDLGALIRLRNLSVRSSAGSGAQTLVVGFATTGEVEKQLLIRAVGPALEAFGVAGFASDPDVTLYDSGSTILTSNDDWGGNAETKKAFGAVGAFALVDNSLDAVLLESLTSGPYTAHITPGEQPAGVVVVEAYDVQPESESRLTNLSARTEVGTGDQVLIAGFVLSGPGEKTLLIRAVGPTLADFGLPAGSLLVNPQLDVRRESELIASNGDWTGGEELKTAFQTVGAFALPDAASLDSALVVTLPAGVYTATVSGVENGTGVVLVEIYEVP